uniref:Uncharacterized protein n=2 Tax=Caenorhabditis japonica TaxID=281687 RepID=A0A8R1DHF6_CAEJA
MEKTYSDKSLHEPNIVEPPATPPPNTSRHQKTTFSSFIESNVEKSSPRHASKKQTFSPDAQPFVNAFMCDDDGTGIGEGGDFEDNSDDSEDEMESNTNSGIDSLWERKRIIRRSTGAPQIHGYFLVPIFPRVLTSILS